MKKLVFLSSTYKIGGGGEISLIDIINKLNSEYEVFCVCRKKGELSNILDRLEIKKIFCGTRWSRKVKNMFSNYTRLYYLYLKLKAISPDLIYSNSSVGNQFSVRLSTMLKIPNITHVRDIFEQSKKDKYLFKNTMQLIANSGTVANLLRVYNKNVEVIYNGVDKNRFHPLLEEYKDEVKRNLNLSGKFLVGNVSTLTYKKGYFDMVRVAEELAKDFPDVIFLVVGRPKDGQEEELEELKREIESKGVDDKFIFLGFIKDISKIIASLDILLFPTHYEAFGRVIIEAMACKVPVVTTYSGGPEEVISDGKDGFLFEVSDIEGMVFAIRRLYKDKKLYSRIADKGYEKFLNNFTFARMINNIEQMITNRLTS